jgi:hypothetical protein
MSNIQSIARIFFILLLAIFLLGISPTPAQAQTASARSAERSRRSPAGLNPADWTQIRALMPAMVIDAQQAYIKASNTEADDRFGFAIAISGDTLVVGAPYEASNAIGGETDNSAYNAGAVYVFTRSGSAWSQQAYLKASNAEADDNFGYSVAISGDTLVVGAYGEDSNAIGGELDNSTLESGAVYVFTRSGSVWSQQAYIKASNPDVEDYFGGDVAISGDTLIVAAPGEDGNATGGQTDNSANGAGAVYVFTRSGGAWSQQAYLKASNTEADDNFGRSLAISGETLVVGASYEDGNATGGQTDNSANDAGAVYVFIRSGSAWSQQAYIKASNTGAGNHFGSAVSIFEDTLVVGVDQEGTFDSGAAYVFTRSGSAWSQQAYLTASNPNSDDGFGESVAISGDTLVVGANREDSNATSVNGDQTNNDASYSGAAYVFKRNGSIWSQEAYLKASNTQAGDVFGSSVAISDGTIVAGAPGESSNANLVNGDQGNDLAPGSGAVYVLVLPPLAVSSLPAGANPTGAASVNFNLTFSEPMTNVDTSDFVLATTGNVTGASITGVSGGPTTYTVSVATGSGEGTIRLDVVDDDSILSVAASTPLGGVGAGNGDFTSGQAYTIDRSGPTVTDIWVIHPPLDTQITAHFTVRFSDNVTGVDVSDFALTTSGVTGASVTNVSGSGTDYTVSVNTGLHIGTIRLDVVDNDSILDAASNPLGGAGAGNGNFNTGQTYIADRTFTVTFNSIAVQDGWVLESSENSNKGGTLNATAKTFQLGDDALNRQYRAILSFNTAPLPNNAVIKAAVLNIRQSGAPVGGNPFSTLGSLWADIHIGSFGSSVLQLADFNSLASASKVGYFKKAIYGYNDSLNAVGRSKINKLGLTQFRLYFAKDDNNNHRADFMKFVAYYSMGTLPNLTITYSVP